MRVEPSSIPSTAAPDAISAAAPTCFSVMPSCLHRWVALVHSRDRLSSSRLQGVAKHTVVAVAYDKRDLVGRRVAWARHDVRFHRTGTKRMHHPLVDDITV